MEARYIEFSAPGEVNLRSEQVAEGDLGPWGVLVRNEATLVSAGTELANLHGIGGEPEYPRRSGYAAVGRLMAKGDAVTDFALGDRVLYAGKHCSAQRFQHGQDHPWGRLYAAPDDMPPERAVFAWLAGISMAAPCATRLDLNDIVAVFGLGLIGNLAAQLYRNGGARVIGLDPVRQRCELARQSGIETALDCAPAQQVQAVLDLTDGEGAHVAVDAAGHSAVVRNCVEATRLFGQVVLLGTPRAPCEWNVTETLRRVHRNGLVMRGAHQWRFPAMQVREAKQTVPWVYRTMFDMIRSGKLTVGPLCSHRIRPEQAGRAYTGLREQRDSHWGVVFDWTDL